jgi:hypothetical protein
MTHAVPTALLGIPGDTMAPPLMGEANFLRNLGVPHIALRKMISGAVIAALFAMLAPAERARMKRSERRTFALSPDVKVGVDGSPTR